MKASKQVEQVQRYIHLVENLELSAETAKDLLHPDYQQWELPNLLNPSGQKSDLNHSYQRMQMAQKILCAQTYKITSCIEQQATVVIETIWTGTMAMDAGALKKDQILKAFFCMFFEFKDAKIHRVRNYDCFEPLK